MFVCFVLLTHVSCVVYFMYLSGILIGTPTLSTVCVGDEGEW